VVGPADGDDLEKHHSHGPHHEAHRQGNGVVGEVLKINAGNDHHHQSDEKVDKANIARFEAVRGYPPTASN